jgi:hypothetical protein
LRDVIQQERAARHRITKPDEPTPAPAPAPATASALEAVLDATTGTAGKQMAWVEVVSPELDPRVMSGNTTIRDLLAGERLGHFLGFADERARRSDFRLGYENFRQWWQGPEHVPVFRDTIGLPDLAVPERTWTGWPEWGTFSLSDVPPFRRFVWEVRLVARLYRELRALGKALHRS